MPWVSSQGMEASPYQGADRRQGRPAGGDGAVRERRALVLACCGVVLVALVFAVGPVLTPRAAGSLTTGIEPLLDAAAVAVAILIGVLCFVRWRLLGQASSLWLAGAMLTYGLFTISVGHLVPAVAESPEPTVLLWLHPASRLVFLGLMVTALVSLEVDARLRPWRVLAVLLAGIAGLTVIFQLVPDLARALAGADDRIAQDRALPTGSLLLISAYTALGVGYFVRGVQLPRRIFPWFGVLLLALAAAEGQRLLPDEPLGVWNLGDVALRLSGLLAAVTGATRDIVFAYGEQGGRLLDSVATGATAEARIRAEQAANEERAHEARNALAAIEGATRTLEHYRDRLDPTTRASLTAAISGEIARLQSLVSAERNGEAVEPFIVERALRHVIAAASLGEAEVTVDIDPSIRALGRGPQTAEVVQNLIVNAGRYAPGSPVHLLAEHEQGGVIIRVQDRGPGVEESERRLIFSRGVRGRQSDHTDGSGLGLYVSLKLMREQSGDLWVEDRPGGGASFALWLPCPEDHHPASQGAAGDRRGAREQRRV
jgi:signal transduction histidine kinase